MSQLKIRYRKIGDLQPYPANPRAHADDVEAIRASIEHFGWTNPLLVQKGTGRIIAGHGRLEAAMLAGVTKVPTIELDMDDLNATAYTIADNRLAELSKWDAEALGPLMLELEAGGFDCELTGFDAEGLAEFLAPEEAYEAEEKGTLQEGDREALAEVLREELEGITLPDLVATMTNPHEAAAEYLLLAAGKRTGGRISLIFNPHRLEVEVSGKPSPLEVLSGGGPSVYSGLARAFLKRGTVNNRPARSLVHDAFTLGFNGHGWADEFQPAVARDLCIRYGVQPDSHVLDPCAGWGGRMIGVSTVCNHYAACEPSSKTWAGLKLLEAFIQRFRPEFSMALSDFPYEDSEERPAFYDFALTSPPYYDTENYSEEATNSLNRYASFEDWRDGFYLPMIHKTMRQLKPGASFILNVGNRKYPLGALLAELDGYEVIREGSLLGKGGRGTQATEDGEAFYRILHA